MRVKVGENESEDAGLLGKNESDILRAIMGGRRCSVNPPVPLETSILDTCPSLQMDDAFCKWEGMRAKWERMRVYLGENESLPGRE